MMLRTFTVLALALGAIAALALPTAASATWKHHGAAIQSDVQLGVTGQTRFQGGLGGVECQITSRIKFFANQTAGQVETYVVHPSSDTTNCKGLGGLAFCQVHDLTPLELPWVFHAIENEKVKSTLTTNGPITAQATGGFCPIKHTLVTSGNIVGAPNQPSTVTSMQLSGSFQADFQTTSGVVDKENMSVSGTLTIESPNAHTYSI